MDTAGIRFEAVREALADKKNILTVKELCELAGVSRSGYYRWIRAGKARDLRETKDREDFEKILEAYQFRGYAKGVRGIHMRLLRMGIRMNVKKIRRLMRKYRLTCPIRKPNPYHQPANREFCPIHATHLHRCRHLCNMQSFQQIPLLRHPAVYHHPKQAGRFP